MTADLATSLLNRAATGDELLQVLDSIADEHIPMIPMTPALRRWCQELYPDQGW